MVALQSRECFRFSWFPPSFWMGSVNATSTSSFKCCCGSRVVSLLFRQVEFEIQWAYGLFPRLAEHGSDLCLTFGSFPAYLWAIWFLQGFHLIGGDYRISIRGGLFVCDVMGVLLVSYISCSALVRTRSPYVCLRTSPDLCEQVIILSRVGSSTTTIVLRPRLPASHTSYYSYPQSTSRLDHLTSSYASQISN